MILVVPIMVTELGSCGVDVDLLLYAEENGEKTKTKEKQMQKQENDQYALLMHDSMCDNERREERWGGRTIAKNSNNRWGSSLLRGRGTRLIKGMAVRNQVA